MARKSRKDLLTSQTIAPVPMTVGYVRLSVNNKENTDSIKSQKRLIEQWADQQQLPIDKFYTDNGFSGTTFDRPAFQELLRDIEEKNIRCVVENYRVQQELIENPMLYYEKYVRGEITADEYRTAMDKNRKIAEVQKEIESEIAKYEQTYQRLCRMQKVLDKQLPLSEIIEEITAITVNSGRKVSVQWKTV